MNNKYTVEKIGHPDEIKKGNWSWGVKDGRAVVLKVNTLNPFDGNIDAHTVAQVTAEALNKYFLEITEKE